MYDGKLIYSIVHLSDFESTGTNEFDTEGFSHHLLSLEGVQLGIIFTEGKKGIKVSFRSKGDVFANELAQKFGGGGHQNAAGAWVENKKIDEIINKVLGEAKNYLK